MRILQVVAELGTGGAEAVVLGLTEGMVARGHRVWVASDHGWRVPRVGRLTGADHLRVPLAARGAGSLASSTARLMAWSPGRPVDLVHAHNVRATLAAAPLARVRRVPLLTTVHGLGAQDYPRAVPLLRRVSDLVVAVSAAVADDLEHAGMPGDRIRLVENAVTPPETAPGADVLPDLPAGEPVVLCAARMTTQKRQDLLLRGWAARRQHTGLLLLAGDGPERARLEALAAELGLGPEVRFLGDRDDVPDLLARADLLVLPSDWEGLPIGVLEALAMGVPVLASQVGGLSDLAAVVELVPAASSETALVGGWARALDGALAAEEGAARRERTRRGRELVAHRFSPDRMVEEYLTLGESLLTRGYR